MLAVCDFETAVVIWVVVEYGHESGDCIESSSGTKIDLSHIKDDTERWRTFLINAHTKQIKGFKSDDVFFKF